MRFLIFAMFAAACLLAGFGFATDLGLPSEEPTSIKEIMEEAMKGGLAKKVIAGEASDEEKLRLLTLLIDLNENEPPQGDATEWTVKSGAAMKAAAKIVVGREGAEKELRTATNCLGCHKTFKPDSP